MSAKKQAATKTAAVTKPAAAPVKGKAAKQTAAPANVQKFPDGTRVVFLGYRTPLQGEPLLTIGSLYYLQSWNDDDNSYNVSTKERNQAIDTVFDTEVRVATAKEIKAAETEVPLEDEERATGKKGTGKAGKTILPKKAVLGKSNKDTAAAAKAKAAAAEKKAKEKALRVESAAKAKELKAAKAAEAKAAKEKAKAEAKAAREAAKAPKPVIVLPSVAKAIKSAAGDLIATAEALCERADSTDFTLGGVLARIQETAAFETLTDAKGQPKYGVGAVGFGNFCEQHLGMKYRKATYLIGIYTTCTRLGVTEQQLSGIGWSKIKEAVNQMTAENVDSILEQAKALPYEQFKQAMKKQLVAAGGKVHGNTDKVVKTTFTFKAFADQAEVISTALALAKPKADVPADADEITANSLALVYIINEWVSMQG